MDNNTSDFEHLSPASAWRFAALSLLFGAFTVYLGYFAQRTDFEPFFAAYAAFFGLYAWVCFVPQPISLGWWMALGIALRVILLFCLPSFSDDYLRFLWDGRLSAAGIHPFLHPPRYFIDHQILLPGIGPELFHRLNSPDYYTVYPPVCQAIFAVAGILAPQHEWLGMFILKLFLLGFEVGVIRLLWKKWTKTDEKRTPHPALLYALNPLILLELVGNSHFEGVMIFFLLASMLQLQQGKIPQSAVLAALATAVKLLPLMFLPLIWRRLGWRKGWRFMVVFGISSLLLFSPLIAVLPNILESLDLYFRQFQFNASVYYLIREIGYLHFGWDIGEQSGPWLGVATLSGLLLIAVLFNPGNKNSRLAAAMLFSLLIYLSFAAVVQPWYVCVPFAISLFTHWRFAVLWTGLVALSYSHYNNGLVLENYALIALEYALLWGFLLWELLTAFKKNRQGA